MQVRLQAARPQEVDVLVDVVTDVGRGRVGLDAEAKRALVFARHDPRPSRYSSDLLGLLASTLQMFGGNSVMNVARRALGHSAVPYDEIVDDVHKMLNGVALRTKTLDQKECEIALALFGANWHELSPEQRLERCTRPAVLAGTFSISDALGEKRKDSVFGLSAGRLATAATIASTGLRLSPVGLAVTTGLAAHKAMAEAYRVTVPFVAQMGWIGLRRRSCPDSCSDPVAANSLSESLAVDAVKSLVIADEGGGELMTIKLFENKPEVAGNRLSEEQISLLNPLIANLGSIAALAEQQHGNYVLCSLPLEALSKAKDGSAMRAWVTDGGKITEHARLKEPEGLQKILVSGAVWNAVSTIVAQKHLHDISEKLTAIKQQLNVVQKELEALRKDKLDAIIRYVQSVMDHYPTDGIDAMAQQQLEHRLVDIQELENYFKGKMEGERQRVADFAPDKLFGNGSVRDKLQESLASMEGWATGYLQAIQLRVITCGLLHMANPLARYRDEASRAQESLQDLPSVAARNQQVYSAQMALSAAKPAQKQPFMEKLNALVANLHEAPSLVMQSQRTFFDQSDRKILLSMKDGVAVEGRLVN